MGHGGRKKLRPFGRVLITIQFRDAGMLSVSEQVFGQEQAILFLAGRLVGAEDWESRSAWLKSEPKPTQPRYLRAHATLRTQTEHAGNIRPTSFLANRTGLHSQVVPAGSTSLVSS